MPETIYVGLDLGSSRCQQTIIGADGMVRSSRVIPTSEQSVRLAFDTLGGDVRVHMEGAELAVWMYSVIRPLLSQLVVSQLVVSHPRSSAWIGKN